MTAGDEDLIHVLLAEIFRDAHRYAPGLDQRDHQAGQRDETGQAGEQAVAELDPLVHRSALGMRLRHQASREALRPGRATQPRTGDSHHRPGHRDAGLGDHLSNRRGPGQGRQ